MVVLCINAWILGREVALRQRRKVPRTDRFGLERQMVVPKPLRLLHDHIQVPKWGNQGILRYGVGCFSGFSAPTCSTNTFSFLNSGNSVVMKSLGLDLKGGLRRTPNKHPPGVFVMVLQNDGTLRVHKISKFPVIFVVGRGSGLPEVFFSGPLMKQCGHVEVCFVHCQPYPQARSAGP